MKKKNVLRMINFDAEIATVVRTTIARSEKYVHLKIALFFSLVFSRENTKIYTHTSNGIAISKDLFLKVVLPTRIIRDAFNTKHIHLYQRSVKRILKQKLKNHFSLQRFFQEEPIQHDFSGVTEFVLKGHGFLGKLYFSQ